MSAVFGESLTFGQENGPEVRLLTFGDEHYHRLETSDGFTVVYDPALGRFCYALVKGERFASSAVPIDRPTPAGLKRHLAETRAARDRTFAARRAARTPPVSATLGPTLRTFGPADGLLEGRRLSIGAVKGLTILVSFQDLETTTTAADVSAMLNGADYHANGNACSVHAYFAEMSARKLDYTNAVFGPFRLSQKRAYYLQHNLVEEALRLAVAAGVQLADYDSRREGIVDAVSILYAGQTQYQGELWPHNGYVDFAQGGVRTSLYVLTSLGRTPQELTIGTLCHETGHLLCRFPDLYDYGGRDDDGTPSAGMGVYCLMAAGNHLDSGRTPAPICAYLRDLAGWCDQVVDLEPAGLHEAIHGAYGTLLRYATPNRNEYFLIENRSKLGFDSHLPASGLAVYHCDTLGSNEWQGGNARRHYQCALLQADGRLDLELDQNQGDGADLFAGVSGLALTDATKPSTRLWNGSESGLVLSAVETPGARMHFRVGPPSTAPARADVRGDGNPKPLPIPDHDPAGVASAVTLESPALARRIRIDVEIEHQYIGDLRVEIVSPKGRRAVLHAQLGGDRKNLHGRYDSDDVGSPLRSLVGEPIAGSWVLRVADLVPRDRGSLKRWSIVLSPATSASPA
jgi:M6 family metalloprotease-like protein